MANESDWRLTGQERYLKGAVLLRRKYHSNDPEWNHDHCAFCWEIFMEKSLPNTLTEGYCTENSRHWICNNCFNDFNEKFGFVVKD